METPDLILSNANIITVDDSDTIAQAVAVTAGRISAVGSSRDIEALAGPGTEMVDLCGWTVVPGFIDAHSHVSIGASYIGKADLQTPPVGNTLTVKDVMAKLHAVVRANGTAPGDYVFAWGYYPESMSDGGSITAAMLDAEFPGHRIMIVNVSGHGGVVNSRVLSEAGYVDGVEDPEGGSIGRYPGTAKPNGVLWEQAWMPLLANLPDYGRTEFEAMLATYASWGMTTVQDGAASMEQINKIRGFAQESPLPIDVRSLVTYTDLDPAIASGLVDSTVGGHTLQGVKLIIDGSPQGRTAFMTTEYLQGGPGHQEHWHGLANMDQELTDEVVEKAYRHGFQVFAHVNGDAAIDRLVASHRAALNAGASPTEPTVPIHSQVMRLEQLDDYVNAGMEPSMFTVHTYLFGDTHLGNFGQEQAFGISPMRSALDRGLRPSNHSDYPITPINPLLLLWSSVSRTSIGGVVMGERERVNPVEGLRALTINAAHEHRCAGDRGSIEVGKLADLVVLDADPLQVGTDRIKDIGILRTYKRGSLVYRGAAGH